MIFLIAGIWIFENWRGAGEWQEAQTRAEEAGLSLVRADYAGSEIPDEENLRQDEIFVKALEDAAAGHLGDWWKLFADSSVQEASQDGRRRRPSRMRTGPSSHPGTGIIFEYREFFDAVPTEEEALSLLAERTRKINARLDVLADIILKTPEHRIFAKEVAKGELFGSSEWSFPMQGLAKCFAGSVRLSMRSGDSERALVLIKALDRLSRISATPGSVDFVITGNIAKIMMAMVWEGLLLEKWSIAQIEELGDLINGRDWGAEYSQVLGHRAACNLEVLNTYLEDNLEPQTHQDGRAHFLSTWFAVGGPEGWDDRRRAYVTNFHLDCLSSLESGLTLDLDHFEKRFEESTLSPLFYWHYQLDIDLSLYGRSFGQTKMIKRIALVALALEKAKLKTKQYPANLSELDEGLELIDFLDPQARELGYQLGPDGRPEIWSIHEQELGERGKDLRMRWQYWPKKSELREGSRPLFQRDSR